MLRIISISFRILLTTIGAAALLAVLSYPENFIAPDPAAIYAQGITLQDLRPWLWVAPLLFMEMVSCAGPRKNLVWFTAMLTVLIGAWVAWPVLLSTRPELVHPTLPFQGGMMAWGLLYFSIILFGSVLLRFVLLRFLFPEPPKEYENSGNMEASVLDPANARTVQEIAADPIRVEPKFHFGDADMRIIERFRLIWRQFILRKRGATAAIWLGIAALLAWFFLYPQPTAEEALERDLNAMYAARITKSGQIIGTTAATHAALRVMQHIDDNELFAGKTREEAEQWLRLQHVAPAYRALLRDERDINLPSVDEAFESRTRFLTVTDGRRVAVLFIRTDAEDRIINVAEVQDAGWDAIADAERRRFGMEFRGNFR